jgi:hypothetical protein
MIEKKGLEVYSTVLVKLLTGPLYMEDRKNWELLLAHRHGIEIYFSKIAMQLHIHETDGFAYLRQYSNEELGEEPYHAPRLIRRHPLTYEVTLLLVLLRERLQQFELDSGSHLRLVMNHDELRDMVTLFFKEKADEVKMLRNIDVVISKVSELGFLRLLPGKTKNEYEVMRLLKAKLPAETLDALREKLASHNANQNPRTGRTPNE